jgi:CheY-like chemotaxis protein
MAAPSDSKKTVLVVEDDAVCREGLGIILERAGYRVLLAGDGLEAVGRVHEGLAPDLILLDMMLPIEDGWRLMERWQQNPVLAAVPVVIITALDASSPEWATSLGAVTCLRKPLDIPELLAEVRRRIR